MRDGSRQPGAESGKEQRSRAPFDGVGGVEFEVVDAEMEFGRDGGETDLAARARYRANVAEHPVDGGSVDQAIFMHGTTPELAL
jgi:hypothetical protein